MLEKFIEEYAQDAFHFAYSLCGDVEQAKELVQEAFFRLMKSWDEYDSSQRLDNWYLAILRNIYFDGLKSADKRLCAALDAPADGEGGEAERSYAETVADARDRDLLDRMVILEDAEAVRRAMDSLSPNLRVVLTMCDIQGLGYEEIAAVLDCPLNTVRSRIFRARENIRLDLERTERKRRMGELNDVR